MNEGQKRKTSWLYGLNPVTEALRAGRGINALYLSSGRRRDVNALIAEAEKKKIPVKIIHDPDFFDSRFPKGHQGVAAAVAEKGYISLEELLEIPGKRGETPHFVILDLVEDPRNLGAILRTAEAAGVHGVVIQERRAAGLTPEAVKTSAGASEYIPVCSINNIKHAIAEMKETGITVVGAEADAELSAWESDLSGPVALVIGSEGGGLRKTVRERCDYTVSLPMRGKVNSLNTSVAAGILIFEILRQKMSKTKII